MIWGKLNYKNKDNTDSDSEDELDIKVSQNHIYFYGNVNSKSIMSLNEALHNLNLPGKKFDQIWLHINSNGGYVYSAMAAVDTIIASETPVNTIIEGMAASAATMLSIVGEKRYIRPYSAVLIHELRGGCEGRKSDIDDEKKNLDRLEKRLINLYKDHSKMPATKLKKMFKRELEYSAKDCVKFGIVDEIFGKKRKRS